MYPSLVVGLHSECFGFCNRLGLEPKLLAKILNTSSGRCWSSEVYNPVPGVLEGVPASNNYQGGFSTALMTKVSFFFFLVTIDSYYVSINPSIPMP